MALRLGNRPVAIFLWLICVLAGKAQSAPLASSSALDSAQAQAQRLALIGHNELHLARLTDAQANCDAALKLDPGNAVAKDCLNLAAGMQVDRDLNNADAKLLSDDRAGAIQLASKWAGGMATPQQRSRARAILKKANGSPLAVILKAILPDWLRQVLVAVVCLSILQLVLLGTRVLWREWRRGKWYGNLTNTTRWTMFPLKEDQAAGQPTGVATDAILDALARVGHELKQPAWSPHLLLLRPTLPTSYEPAIITEFISANIAPIVIAPPADDLRLEWSLHDIRLDEALENLQLKVYSGVDLGSIARFMASIMRWFNAGAPVISGVARSVPDKSVSLHLVAHGGRIQSAAVNATTDVAPGIDATELCAERVAFKFLFRMRYPAMTNDQIDGFSALRQGSQLFSQFGGTVPGTGEDANVRTSSLARAAFNLSSFRASIPIHCDAGRIQKGHSSLNVTDDVRQAALLAEGIAHALVGTEEERMQSIDCFRQLQDWPGSPQTEVLRQQAAYNEALVWAHCGNVARSVLMLTELLGQRAPDIVPVNGDHALPMLQVKAPLPHPIQILARVARVNALAQYDRNAWSVVPECRIALIVDDAEALITDLEAVCAQTGSSAHDHRLTRYLYAEALRATAHVQLLLVIHTKASLLYENYRPTGLLHASVDSDAAAKLHHAISLLLTCEQLSPSADLYCDLAESYLLLKQFTTAQGYARHAILESNPPSERAYYLAVESFTLEDTSASIELARKYARDFSGTVKLPEFKLLLAKLGLSEEAPLYATAQGGFH
jgi:hypothetical protein